MSQPQHPASKREPSPVVLAVFSALGAASAFTGVAMLFLVEHRGPDEFVYFTVQSNLLVGFCFLWAAIARCVPRRLAQPQAFLRGAVTLYITVTFLVFHFVLANPSSGFGDGSDQFGTVQNVLLHTVTPLLALLDWLLVGVERPRWRWAAAWLTYPVAYLAFVLVRGVIVHRYPYPFLDVKSIGYGQVAIAAAVLFVVFWLLGLLVVTIGRLGRRTPSRVPAPAAEATSTA
jgi:hypothetical protein